MADLTVRTFDPKQVVVALGPYTLTGFNDGTFIKIKRGGKPFEKKVGADGTVDRINKNRTDFDVDVVLKQTSPLNAILSGALVADQLTNDGIYPLTIADLSGKSLFEAPQAWVSEDPDVEYADSLGGRAWKFETGAGANLIGGN